MESANLIPKDDSLKTYGYLQQTRRQSAADSPTAQLCGSTDSEDLDQQLPSNKRNVTTSRPLNVVCILLVELCERITYYSVTTNMVIFCTNQLRFTSPVAVTVSLVFTGTSYFLPLIGGWVADSFSGRFNVILGSALIYMIGVILLPVVGANLEDVFGRNSNGELFALSVGARRGYYLLSIVLIAIGTSMKSNISPFGAQQIQNGGKEAVESFFNWFFWFINIGSIVSFSVAAYVQQEVGFGIGYSIPAVSMLIATIVYIIPRNRYVHHFPNGSALTRVFRVLFESCRGVTSRCKHGRQMAFLQYSHEKYGGSCNDRDIEDTKTIARLLPLFSTLILYYTLNLQSSSFLLQGERLNLRFGSLQFPAASLNLFNTASVLIFIPVVQYALPPLFKRLNYKPSDLQKMGLGMAIVSLSALCAAVLEICRKQEISASGGFVQQVAGRDVVASYISVLWQVPQYALIGCSEVFTVVTSYEFAYSQSPLRLQGFVMGLVLLTMGLGGYMGSAILNIVNLISWSDPWFPNEINDGHVEYFFLVLFGCIITNLIAYVFIVKWYSSKMKNVDTSHYTDSIEISADTKSRTE